MSAQRPFKWPAVQTTQLCLPPDKWSVRLTITAPCQPMRMFSAINKFELISENLFRPSERSRQASRTLHLDIGNADVQKRLSQRVCARDLQEHGQLRHHQPYVSLGDARIRVPPSLLVRPVRHLRFGGSQSVSGQPDGDKSTTTAQIIPARQRTRASDAKNIALQARARLITACLRPTRSSAR